MTGLAFPLSLDGSTKLIRNKTYYDNQIIQILFNQYGELYADLSFGTKSILDIVFENDLNKMVDFIFQMITYILLIKTNGNIVPQEMSVTELNDDAYDSRRTVIINLSYTTNDPYMPYSQFGFDEYGAIVEGL